MEVSQYSEPWDYILISNFLPIKMFDFAQNIAKSNLDFETPKHKSMLNYNHDKNFEDWCSNLYPFFCKTLNVKIITPVKILFQYTCYNNFDDSSRYDGGIHTDSFDKQISCLIPLSDKGSGTMLYNDKKELAKQIEWKQNTAFIFANKPNHWHSVGLANETSRCLLNVIYMPKNYSIHHEKIYKVKRSRDHLVKNK